MPSSLVGLALAVAWFVIAVAAIEAILRVVDGLAPENSTPATIAARALGPSVLAGFFVIGVFVPAQFILEPRGAVETLNFTVLSLCAVAATVLTRTARCAVRMLAACNRFACDLAVSERLASVNVPMPVLVVEDVFPVAMLVGLVSPQIVISRRFKETLTDALLKACRFIEDFSRRPPISSCVYSGAPIARRVTRLLEARGESRARARGGITAWATVGAALAVVAIYPFAMITVHRASEWLLNGLP